MSKNIAEMYEICFGWMISSGLVCMQPSSDPRDGSDKQVR